MRRSYSHALALSVKAITDARLDDSAELVKVFGLWDQILYSEFDGRRRKRVLAKIIGE